MQPVGSIMREMERLLPAPAVSLRHLSSTRTLVPVAVSLARYLARLGYGTRKEAEQLLRARRVTTGTGSTLREGRVQP
jgi:hypothetical protein